MTDAIPAPTLFVCQPGYEDLMAAEIGAPAGLETGQGWVLAVTDRRDDLAFAQLVLEAPARVEGEAVNKLAAGILGYFSEALRGRRIDGPWPCVFAGSTLVPGLGRRVGAVEAAFGEALKGKLGRVARLAHPGVPAGVGPCDGLFVWFAEHGRAYASVTAIRGGQRRMADDPSAPSRSYLKVEEAYGLIGAEPAQGETVCDLGAAPGGWSFSAAKRGARVLALDNGPLKAGALAHPGIEHRRVDAFGFRPDPGTRFDWLFCDIVEEPHHVMRSIVGPWIEQLWCSRLVVNLKFGRADAVSLLAEIRSPQSPFARCGSTLRVRHLFHDRDEFTVTGSLIS